MNQPVQYQAQQEFYQPIIVINHTPKVESLIDTDTSLTYVPTPEVYDANTVDSISFEDIDPLIEILNSISSIFDSYYEAIPPEIAQKGPESHQTGHVVQLYSKIGNFVKEVIIGKDQMKSNIDYINAKISQFKTTESDVIYFYGLERNYKTMTNKSKDYTASDSKFNAYFANIQKAVASFAQQATNIQAACSNLSKLNDFFALELSALQDLSASQTTIEMLEKFDKVLMLTVRLVEIRLDIENAIKTMKGNFLNMKDEKILIAENIVGAERLAEYHSAKATQKSPLSSSTSSVKRYSTLVLIALVAFNS